ncbi:glycosyltransferase [Paenibacillus vulneris]|uniref:Glycosyltransferase n=1 Tax=Paenibacillus vulneris TaxID=1133364 RepID=A0ABW3UGE2_9BACL
MSTHTKKIIKGLKLLKSPKILVRKLIYKTFFRNVLIKFPSQNTILEELELLFKQSQGRKIFVFPGPSCPWGYMFQRPQQLARSLANLGYTVIYLVDLSFPYSPDWNVRGLKKVQDNIYLYNDNMQGQLLIKSITQYKINNIVVWQYWPHQHNFVKKLPNYVTKIYDCIDHINTFNNYENIYEDFKESLIDADLVLATAKKILAETKNIRADCYLIPNGVHFEDFNIFYNKQYPSNWGHLAVAKKENKYIVGYYGAIADWFDFEAVNYMAVKNPNCIFLLVGEVYPSVEDKIKQLKNNSNVVILPRVTYSQIPQLLSFFDVAMIPFKLNDITLNTSPVKVYEYMAGGKLTIASNMPEINNMSAVLIASSVEDFDKKLKLALTRLKDPFLRDEMQRIAQANTWNDRIREVLCLLNQRL